MVTQFLNDSSDIQPTHPIMISKIHVTLPFTSSDFLPYRFPPTALFNLGRLGAFSVPQEASSEHLLAPPATWEVLSRTDLHHCRKNPKVDGFLLQELPREHPLRNDVFENPKSDKIEDLGHPSMLEIPAHQRESNFVFLYGFNELYIPP